MHFSSWRTSCEITSLPSRPSAPCVYISREYTCVLCPGPGPGPGPDGVTAALVVQIVWVFICVLWRLMSFYLLLSELRNSDVCFLETRPGYSG